MFKRIKRENSLCLFWNKLRHFYIVILDKSEVRGIETIYKIQKFSTILCKVVHTKTLTARFLPSLIQTCFSRIMLIFWHYSPLVSLASINLLPSTRPNCTQCTMEILKIFYSSIFLHWIRFAVGVCLTIILKHLVNTLQCFTETFAIKEPTCVPFHNCFVWIVIFWHLIWKLLPTQVTGGRLGVELSKMLLTTSA